MSVADAVRPFPALERPQSAPVSAAPATSTGVTLDGYMAKDLYKIDGFLKSLDARVIRAVADWQAARGVRGGLAEIGIHHGKLFFILALSRQTGERALAMDLFTDDALNAGTASAGRDRAFFTHARRMGVELTHEEILKGDSLELSPDDILERTGPVRLFSVDGGHLYHHVDNDLRLADAVLHDQGVIAIDDFCNATWPEVTFAAFDFLKAARESIAPAVLTKNKLYVCRPAAVSFYEEAITASSAFGDATPERVTILGREVLFLRQDLKSRAVDELRSKFARRF